MNTTSKPWYMSKTIWLAVAQAIGGVLLVVETQYPGVGSIVIIKSLADLYIRIVTVAPITA